MFDKILVAGGILLGTVLFIENMVIWLYWYLFLYRWVNNGIVILVAIFIGVAMWYGLKWIFNKKEYWEEDEDFY